MVVVRKWIPFSLPFALLAGLSLAAVPLAGCEEEGPMEEAGEEMDEAMEETGEKAEELKEKTAEKLEDEDEDEE